MQKHLRSVAIGTLAVSFTMQPAAVNAQQAPQTVFLDKNPKIVAYQLNRLENAQLLAVERKPDHAKYKLVYKAILVRKGVERKFRQESADGLAKLNTSDPVVEILAGIGEVEKDDATTQGDLIGLLLTQKPEALAGQKSKIEALAAASDSASVKEAAYAALVVADGRPDAVWQAAGSNQKTLPLLLGSVAMLPDVKLKASFYEKVNPLVAAAPDETTRVAAIDAIGFIPGHDAETFTALADLLKKEKGNVQAAAVRSLRRIPAKSWPADQVGPLAAAVVKVVSDTPTDQRTTPAVIETIQLGEELAAALPAEQGKPIRKSLRELGVRTILVRTLKEQMAYDLRYFVVQAGKPVQIVLDNPDAMPHNLVITAPGAVQEIGEAGGVMQPPADPNAKAFVPANPKVLESSHLVQPGKSETMKFDAPKEPGEYGYVCTFPGHWVRMYGVMLVVPDLDAYDQNPVHPTDPVTKKPFESAKLVATDALPEHKH